MFAIPTPHRPERAQLEASPSDCASPITSREPFLPDPFDLMGDPLQSPTITTDAVVGVVAP